MITQCPKCLKTYQLLDSHDGKQVRCPHCKDVFTASEIRQPVQRSMMYDFGVAIGNIKRRAFRAWIMALLVTLSLVSFIAYKVGHKNGVKDGYCLAIDTQRMASKPRADVPSLKISKMSVPAEYAPLSPCSIISVDYKTILGNEIMHQISWQVKCLALDTKKVNVHVLFYDKDGYLLQKESLYGQYVEASRAYTYSDTTIFDPASAKKIVSVDAKIE